jgi:hypothetical protein
MEKSKSRLITEWVLIGIVSLLVIMSSILKIASGSDSESAKNFMKWGLENQLKLIGVFELILGILFLIPRTFSVGVLLLTAYFGGAIATHLEHGEENNVVIPVIILLLIWASCYLRSPNMFASLLKKQDTINS